MNSKTNSLTFSFIIIFLISFQLTYSQSATVTNKYLPTLAPSSPEAAAFAKYGNYEVNLFTGVPDITIPLYDIKIGELTIPVSMSYHASGIRVNEMPSRIGLGWDLRSGGAITRKIMGKPDEMDGNYLLTGANGINSVRSSINDNTQTDLDYLNNVDGGLIDVQPDIFSYSFPGHSGKFLFNQTNNYAPILIPYAPVSVSMSASFNTLNLAMTDEAGINYKFDVTEMTNAGGGTSVVAHSAWLLSEMISANKEDSIHLRYNVSGSGTTDRYFSDYVTVDDNCVGGYSANFGIPSSDDGSVYTIWKQLTQIDFKNGKVVFESAPESRQDFNSGYSLQNRLNAIKIYNYDILSNTYNLLRSIQFYHSYFITGTDVNTKRLRLDSIQIKAGGGEAIQTYRFSYNTSVGLPDNLTRMKDYWGYFNNINNLRSDGFPTMVPRMQVDYLPTSTIWIGGDHINARDPDPAYMQACILQKINYPTGGNTQFEYETNQYLDAQGNSKYAGGLRIKSIKSYTGGTAAPIIKTYKYGLNETGYGRNNFLLENYFFSKTQNYRGGFMGGILSTKRGRIFFANPTNDLEGFDGAPVVYQFVTEYTGDETTNAGKSAYTFSDRADARTDIIGYNQPMFDSYHFIRGLLINKTDFKNNGNSTYTKIQETRKSYQYFPLQFSIGGIGLVVFKPLVTLQNGNYVNCNISTLVNNAQYTDIGVYRYNLYDILSGDNKIVADTTIIYDQADQNNSLSTITKYTYDDVSHLGIAQTQTTTSKNESIVVASKYPYNYATAPYTNMTASHIFNKVIEQTVTNNLNPVTVQTNNYGAYYNNYLTSNIQLQTKSNPVETRASFNTYDNRGNILEMQKSNDLKQSLIWDYNKLYPVAQVTDAARADIAYTSFEAEGKGNWTFAGVPVINATALTGKRAYNLSSGNISIFGLSTPKTYIVSYWSRNAVQSVNGIAAVTGNSLNGWTYYEHKIVNPPTSSITVSGTGTIDELRMYPLGAQMTTYTYEPLVGLSSQCDANNRLMYYEYDGMSRLSLIRDQDKNILKKYCYNYAGQLENCNYFYNTVQFQSFTKTCTGGATGSQVTYTVPINTYGSSISITDANAKALTDISSNGQAYADANGICTANLITVQGYNNKTSNYNLKLTNVSTGTIYYFTLNANTTITYTLGQVPSGTYTVVFYPSGAPVTCTYNINGFTYYGTGATFNNIAITATSNARMY